MKNIRNFCIIAHIDHGKSTLSDRLLEYSGSIDIKEKKDQILDDMDLERERGITIKSHAVQINYSYKGEYYTLNLIDTPGHVDFSYEVLRSINSCEGALLLVDATQGIQAQTISNLYLAIDNYLEVIPIINKIDMPNSYVESTSDDILDLIGCEKEDIILASAKTGEGIEKIFEAIINKIPPPQGDINKSLDAFIFDSVYNPFRGVEIYFRVMNGSISRGEQIKFLATEKEHFVEEIGVLKLKKEPKDKIEAGNVGYLISGIKNPLEVKVGDSISYAKNSIDKPTNEFRDIKPMIYAGLYPVETDSFELLKNSLYKLQLNDASLKFETVSSAALGFGFNCGFLGLLHMEIIQERLDREFNISVITTAPNVTCKIYKKKNIDEAIIINTPSELPDVSFIDRIEEPFIQSNIITKTDFIGQVIKLCIDKRGVLKNQNYLTTDRVELIFEIPLSEVVFDFYDKLKTITKGYSSFDYKLIGFKKSDLIKLDLLINGVSVDALSLLTHRSNSYKIGKQICEKLKELIPKQQFDIAIQAAIGAKIIARETQKALRKDVTAKCYGGDITRKRKLIEKQKKGKKRMRQIGKVEVPQKAFLAIMKLNN